VSRTKREHTVPQSYLRRFSQPNGQLWAFDKVLKTAFPTSITNVACVKDFYPSVEERQDDSDPQLSVEEILSRVEGISTEMTDTFLRGIDEGEGMDPEWKRPLAFLIHLQLIRTLESRHMQAEMHEAWKQALSNMVRHMELPDDSEVRWPDTIDAESVEQVQANVMLNPDSMLRTARILVEEYAWVVGTNRTRLPLYASDHPVVTDRVAEGQPFWSTFALPLTPRCVVALHHRSQVKNSDQIDCKVIPLDDRDLLYFNGLQVIECTRHVFSPRKQFNHARYIFNRYPEWCKRDRSRVGDRVVIPPAGSLSESSASDPLEGFVAVGVAHCMHDLPAPHYIPFQG